MLTYKIQTLVCVVNGLIMAVARVVMVAAKDDAARAAEERLLEKRKQAKK